MDISGVRVPREPRIMQMDWKSLGYKRVKINGMWKWVPEKLELGNKDEKNKEDSKD
jgi:hypothetical protein